MTDYCKGCAVKGNGCIYASVNYGSCPCGTCLVKMVCADTVGCERWSGPGPKAFTFENIALQRRKVAIKNWGEAHD